MESILEQVMFGWRSPWGAIVLAAVLMCLLCGAALFLWGLGLLVGRIRAERSFMKQAAGRGFDREASRILWNLGRFAAPRERAEILSSVDLFDRCVTVARGTLGGDPRCRPAWLSPSRLDAIRRWYDTSRARSRHHFATTREIEYNQPVTVRCPDGYSFDAFVLQATEQGLYLSHLPRLGLEGRLTAGARLTVRFWRPRDARYEFDTCVVSAVDMFARTFLVAHAPLRRIQERGYVRVRWHRPVHVAPMGGEGMATGANDEAPSDDALSAQLRDVSVGGASFRCAARLSQGRKVLLRLPLGPSESLTLPGQVVRQSPLNGTSQEAFLTSIRFEGLLPAQENRLARLVAHLQQGLIRRMVSRSAATAAPSPAGVAEKVSRSPEKTPLAGRRGATPADTSSESQRTRRTNPETGHPAAPALGKA